MCKVRSHPRAVYAHVGKLIAEFPLFYFWQNIKEAFLTYPYHCCAFSFPAEHRPDEYRRHLEFVARLREKCANNSSIELDTSLYRFRERRSPDWVGGFGNVTIKEDVTEGFGDIQGGTDAGHHFDSGTFHSGHYQPGPRQNALCGELSKNYGEVRCLPVPDAFSPCEDLMGNWALRVAVWFVASAAVTGNAAVLVVLLARGLTVPRFLMCHLAAADLAMGIYLLMLAAMDARSIGSYFNYAIDWQNGPGCAIAGFLTVFACELSILSLTVLTAERWYTITYAIHMNRRLRLGTAARIMAVGWVYAASMAALPLVGVSGYHKTSICLPLQNRDSTDQAYLGTLLVFNAVAFLLICACYARMYCAIRGGTEGVATLARSDMTVAKRMALLVATDLCCWAPIAFFGLTALLGHPLIDVTRTKILLVFFYPLNACANPFLYALLTRQFRRDALVLLSRHGLCTERAVRYRLGGGVQRPVRGVGTGASPGGSPGAPGAPNYTGCGRRTERGERGSVLTTFTSVDCGPLQTLSVSPNSLNVPPALSALTQSNHVISPSGQRSALTTLPETPCVNESVELHPLDGRLIICNNNAIR